MFLITAHDSTRFYADMAKVSKMYADKHGYPFRMRHLEEVKTMKSKLMLEGLEEGHDHVAWVDSDSVILHPINELHRDDYDIALCVKEATASKRLGKYLYSGFVVANQTEAAKDFLTKWGSCTAHRSDQRNLHDALASELDDTIYNRIGEVIELQSTRFLLLDHHIYCQQEAIKAMNAPAAYVKILHFKGRLHRAWPEYASRFLCS
jgi:hypothetical protein